MTRKQTREPQKYDQTLKALFGRQASRVLPYLLPGVEVIEEQNIEVNRSTLRADLVFLVLYKGKQHIVNMELQTDGRIELRVL
jgi:hypothetical protein